MIRLSCSGSANMPRDRIVSIARVKAGASMFIKRCVRSFGSLRSGAKDVSFAESATARARSQRNGYRAIITLLTWLTGSAPHDFDILVEQRRRGPGRETAVNKRPPTGHPEVAGKRRPGGRGHWRPGILLDVSLSADSDSWL
jgi:hypothetical protein